LKWGLKKVLIEKDFPETVGPVEMVWMAEHLGSRVMKSRSMIATTMRALNELGKKLARNRDSHDAVIQLFR